MFINHSSKEVTAKVVYYGPGLSGKTTNLQYIFSITNPKTRGELISIETEIERTLFFDLLPINVGLVKGYQTKFQLYTVPGQVFYDSTRKLVLKGADGVVFVADSQELMKTANLESLENLKKNLAAHKLDVNDIPIVFQYNKRDLNNTMPVEDLNRILNPMNYSSYDAVATEGTGVVETLREISSLILRKIKGLLEHNGEDAGKTPPVNFDTDKRHKIIDKEDLPLKKIQTDNLETASAQVQPQPQPQQSVDAPATAPPPPDIPDENIEEPHFDEDPLKVETVEPDDDLSDLEELVLGEDMSHVEELADLQEINLGDEPDEKEASAEQETVKLDEENALDTGAAEGDTNELAEPGGLDTIDLEEQDGAEHFEELEGFDGFDLGDIDDENLAQVEELPELQEIKLSEEDSGSSLPPPAPAAAPPPAQTTPQPPKPPESAKLPQPPESVRPPQPPQPPQPAPAVEPAQPAPPAPEEQPFELNVESLEKPKPAAKSTAKPAAKPAAEKNLPGLDLFDQLKDKTRVTVIRKVDIKDSQFLIEIKDNDSNVLDTVRVDITPETKKVTLILDVKK